VLPSARLSPSWKSNNLSHSSTKGRALLLVVGIFLVHCAAPPKASETGSGPGDLELSRLPPKVRERVKELRAELAKAPGSTGAPGLWLDLAMTLHVNGESAAGAEAYAEVLVRQPDNAVAMYLRSHALRTAGELEAAAEQLSECLDSGARYPAASRTVALWALEDGNLERARQAVEEAFGRSPDAPGIRAAKVRINMASGDYVAAEEAVLGAPEGIEGEDYLGYLAARLKQARSGERPEDQPVAEPRWSDPWLEELRRYRGGTAESLREAQAAIAAGQPRTAIEILEPVLRWEPDDPRVTQVLAVAHRDAKNHGRALEILETAIQHQPGVLETHVQLVTTRFVLALESGDAAALREAAAEAGRLREIWPDDWRSNALAGDVLYSAGEPERALEAYLQCSSLQFKAEARCEFKAARALVSLGRPREAQALLIETFGEAPEAEDAVRLLAVARQSLSEAG